MNNGTLFSLALGLQSPWEVKEIKFVHAESKRKELHLQIGFAVGARFADEAGNLCGVYDTVELTWQHLNFFEHTCYLHCAVLRIKTSAGKVINVAVPWARANSGFTLLFEALVLAMIEREMPVNRVAELMQVNPQCIWTIFNHWVGKALMQTILLLLASWVSINFHAQRAQLSRILHEGKWQFPIKSL